MRHAPDLLDLSGSQDELIAHQKVGPHHGLVAVVQREVIGRLEGCLRLELVDADHDGCRPPLVVRVDTGFRSDRDIELGLLSWV
ncbi:hypothetical protein D9M69_594390 [compost metagenome]